MTLNNKIGNADHCIKTKIFLLQLLNQMEGAGPPPADADKIKSLPKIIVSQELLGKNTVQPNCKE